MHRRKRTSRHSKPREESGPGGLLVILGMVCLASAGGAFWQFLRDRSAGDNESARISMLGVVITVLLAGVFFVNHYRLNTRARFWAARRNKFPDQPWKWWPGWATGVIGARMNSRVGWWCLSAAFATCLVIGWQTDSRKLPDSANLRMVIRMSLAVAAVLTTLGFLNSLRQWWRNRKAVLQLHTFPINPGGKIEATVTLPYRLRPTGGFQVRLVHVYRRIVNTAKGHAATWEDELQRIEAVSPTADQTDSQTTSFQVQIQLPEDAREGDFNPNDLGHHWRLQIRAEVIGQNLLAEFPLPVFKNVESPSGEGDH